MQLAYTLNIPATDIGYSLYDLLVTAIGAGPALNFQPFRVAQLKLSWEAGIVYVVPASGTYVTTTGTVPDQYGFSIDTTVRVFDLVQHANCISLKEINVGASAADTKVHLYAYSI